MIEIRVETVFSADEIARRVRELGAQLDGELSSDPLLVSLLGGSVIFLADLVRSIPRPVRYEFIHVETSGGDDEPLALHFPVPFAVAGESVVLLKDVVTTGVTEEYLLGQLRSQGAKQVRLAALVDIPSERKTEVGVDYAVLTSERAGRLVGYGLKHRGRHGNLPYIGRLAATT